MHLSSSGSGLLLGMEGTGVQIPSGAPILWYCSSMSTLTWEERNQRIKKEQLTEEELGTLVGCAVTGVRRFWGHGAEYEIRFDDGRTLYITKSDYTNDVVCMFKEF